MAEVVTGVEQRKHIRYVCVNGGLMRLSIRPEFRGRRAVLVDLSVQGIGFLLKEELEAGTVVVFEIQGPGDDGPMSRLARVRHTRSHPTPADAPWLPASPVVSRLFRSLFGMKAPEPAAPSWLIGCEFDRSTRPNSNSFSTASASCRNIRPPDNEMTAPRI
jgi:hypothetical protein